MTYRVDDDRGRSNPAWDAFVDRTPGGHHAQTTLWAAVKATLGWDAIRLVVRRDGEITGGVQLLTKRMGPVGTVAFAPRGPVLDGADPAQLDALQDALMAYGRQERIRYLKVQPPDGRHDVVRALRGRGWAPSAIEAAPTATVRIRIDHPEDDILAAMRKSTRRGIRKAAGAGLRVRPGREADLGTFASLVRATAERQGFAPYPARYYEAMFRVFSEQERCALFVAELDGRVLAGTLSIAFGDSVVAKMGGWCGDRDTVHPNASIDWATMRWGHELGARWFDFDGMAMSIARAAQANLPLPEEAHQGAMCYKLGFGGEIEIFPQALDCSPIRILRPAVRLAAPRLRLARSVAHRALGRRGSP